MKRISVSADELVELFQTQIKIGQLRPGQHFPSRSTIKKNLKAGNSTIFNATERLKSLGLIHTSPTNSRLLIVSAKGGDDI